MRSLVAEAATGQHKQGQSKSIQITCLWAQVGQYPWALGVTSDYFVGGITKYPKIWHQDNVFLSFSQTWYLFHSMKTALVSLIWIGFRRNLRKCHSLPSLGPFFIRNPWDLGGKGLENTREKDKEQLSLRILRGHWVQDLHSYQNSWMFKSFI